MLFCFIDKNGKLAYREKAGGDEPMGEANELLKKIKYDIQAMKQDNAGFRRKIEENERKIAEFQTIEKALVPLCGGEQDD